LPAIVFSFSKKKCETLAYGLSTVNLTTAVEKSQIHQFIEESLTRLKGTDRKLPQVQYVKEILKRGKKFLFGLRKREKERERKKRKEIKRNTRDKEKENEQEKKEKR